MILEPLLTGKVNVHICIGMGLLDYCFIIKNPMDLGTVNAKLRE